MHHLGDAHQLSPRLNQPVQDTTEALLLGEVINNSEVWCIMMIMDLVYPLLFIKSLKMLSLMYLFKEGNHHDTSNTINDAFVILAKPSIVLLKRHSIQS